jgi:hypothetical protein
MRFSQGFVTPLFIGGLVILAVWLVIALFEILAPGQAIRWRRRFLNKREHRIGSAQVAAAFDHITHERDDPHGWRDPSVQQRVRMIGFVNLALAVLFASFLVLASR